MRLSSWQGGSLVPRGSPSTFATRPGSALRTLAIGSSCCVPKLDHKREVSASELPFCVFTAANINLFARVCRWFIEGSFL